jgi:hypothetical protein
LMHCFRIAPARSPLICDQIPKTAARHNPKCGVARHR